MKKLLYLLLLIILSSSVFASFELTRKIYGPDQNFEGILSVNKSSVSLDEKIKGDVLSCGSYTEKEALLYDLLVNSGQYSGKLYTHEAIGNGFTTINYNSGEKDYGFQIEDTIKNFSFDISSNTGKIKIDIGLNGYDWEYFGGFKAWGNTIYGSNYDESYSSYIPNYQNVINRTSRIDRCGDFIIPFEDLQSNILVRINAVARRVEQQGNLIAEIGSKTCTFQNIGSDWTNTFCNITLDLTGETSPLNKRICISSVGDSVNGAFKIPEVPPATKYYFITVNPALYGDYKSSFSISNNLLRTKVNEYFNSECNDELCTIPFRLTGDSSFTMNPVLKLSDGSDFNLVYNVDSDALRYNLTEKNLDISYFEELKTPLETNNLCQLEIEFLNNDYAAFFNVSDKPIPIIDVTSEIIAKDISVEFDGSSSMGNIVSWEWDFGDGKSAQGKVVEHTYTSEGTYNVNLIITDTNDVESTDFITIQVANLEEVLDIEIPNRISELNNSDFEFIESILKEFYNNMNYDSIVTNSIKELEKIESNFSSIKNSALSQNAKDIEYIDLYNKLDDLSKITPIKLEKLSSLKHVNYTLTDLDEVQTFSKILGFGNIRDIKNEIYLFNQRGVKGDYEYTLIKVDYLSGDDNYVYAKKQFTSSRGGEFVDDLTDYGAVRLFTSGCVEESSTDVIYCSNAGTNFNLRYAVLSDEIIFNSGFYVPVEVYDEGEIIYQHECDSEDCDYSYCGDDLCFMDSDLGINESLKGSSYHCPQDCGQTRPWMWYITLGIILIFGVFWINFYRGPGNFFDVTNAISFKLFNRRLFLIKKDRIILRTYIIRALREGYSEGDIRLALRRKGWTKKQLNFVFEEVKHILKQQSPKHF